MSTDSHVIAEEPAVDFAIATEMASELEDYIVGDDLYRTVIVRTPRGDEKLTMTGGDLLTRIYRLNGVKDSLDPAMQSRIDALTRQVNETIYSLKTRFHERLQRELKARLNSLKWYLDDCAGDVKRCRTNYPYEIRNRQRIEEILKRIAPDLSDEENAALHGVDQRLRMLTHGSDFVWSDSLKNLFPPSPYWYLYTLP